MEIQIKACFFFCNWMLVLNLPCSLHILFSKFIKSHTKGQQSQGDSLPISLIVTLNAKIITADPSLTPVTAKLVLVFAFRLALAALVFWFVKCVCSKCEQIKVNNWALQKPTLCYSFSTC